MIRLNSLNEKEKNWEFLTFSKFNIKAGFMKESTIFTEHNLTEKVHYVYRVIIDGKYYIGKHTGFLNDLITGRYRTSSKLVHEKLKNGTHFSKIKIIRVFSTPEEALEFEKKILTRVDARRNPKFLNQTNGTGNDLTFKQHTEKSKEKLSKKAKAQFDINTEEGRKRRELQSERMKEANNINTEEGRKRRENHSKKMKEYLNPNTELGRLHLEENRRKQKEVYDENTERGRRNRENQSEIQRNVWDPNTERGRKLRENQSQSAQAYFDINTEEGRRNLEKQSQISLARFDENTEEGRRNKEKRSQLSKAQFDPETERGKEIREKISQSGKARFDINTEEGRRNREHQSEKGKEYFNPNTEEGRKNLEKAKVFRQKGIETRVQNRKNSSILGDLMFDEEFIRENFFITDDKNNPRFLSPVYSKLSGYSESQIVNHKRNGKLRFLYGIKSIIKITEESELAKIEEIKAIIKSRNEELSLKAS